jgi:hypothetical protein
LPYDATKYCSRNLYVPSQLRCNGRPDSVEIHCGATPCRHASAECLRCDAAQAPALRGAPGCDEAAGPELCSCQVSRPPPQQLQAAMRCRMCLKDWFQQQLRGSAGQRRLQAPTWPAAARLMGRQRRRRQCRRACAAAARAAVEPPPAVQQWTGSAQGVGSSNAAHRLHKPLVHLTHDDHAAGSEPHLPGLPSDSTCTC